MEQKCNSARVSRFAEINFSRRIEESYRYDSFYMFKLGSAAWNFEKCRER